ncbi:MAG TPA: stage II sporulation protein R [Clostridiales bacterium]|nr:stage II sporulation protein R [Clostridiales bacterium]
MKKECAVLVALLLIAAVCTGMIQRVQRDDLIRLHVIANSDSPEDQALKLRVRDKLLLSFGDLFRSVRTIDEARVLIESNLDNLKETALTEIRKQGYEYQVEAQLGVYPFPTKVYGSKVYPAGRYEALRVVIGEGKGANWWCVMFPPLCFVDVSTGVVSQADEAAVGKGNEDNSGRDEETAVYTFKLAELWESFKKWLISIFSG